MIRGYEIMFYNPETDEELDIEWIWEKSYEQAVHRGLEIISQTPGPIDGTIYEYYQEDGEDGMEVLPLPLSELGIEEVKND